MRKLVVAGAAIAAAAGTGCVLARRWWATWGVDPAEAGLALPGDELVPEPTVVDTRGITIEAPPAAVWPWLAQLGYGRGGWYSYDQLDMKGRSADEILPGFQSLAVGDIVPTDPRGGFEAKIVEPGRALVLMIDSEIAARRRAPGGSADATATAAVEASGKLMASAMPPQFAVSWAIVLQPLPGGRTRLIERLRAGFGSTTDGSRLLGPVLELGIFVMTRRQMLGIAERAERLARRGGGPVATGPAPVSSRVTSGNGHAPELQAAIEPGS